MADIDTIRERHQMCDGIYCDHTMGLTHCSFCDWEAANGWPCDTRVVLDALGAVQAAFLRLQEWCEGNEPGLLDAFWFREHAAHEEARK